MRFLITMGKMKIFGTLYFKHLVHQALNHLETMYLANHHFQIGTLKQIIEKITNLMFSIQTTKLFDRPSYISSQSLHYTA